MDPQRIKKIRLEPIPVTGRRRRIEVSRARSEAEEVTALLALIEPEIWPRHAQVSDKIVKAGLLLLALGSVVALGAGKGFAWLFLSVCGMGLASVRLPGLGVSRRQLKAVRQLTGYDDLRAIRPLARALGWRNAVTRRAATVALTRLLPRLPMDEAMRLDERSRALLCHELKMENAHRREEFVCAILQMVQRTGDYRSLSAVSALAHGRARTPAQKRMQMAARACQADLLTRIAEQQDSRSLLRASDDTQDIANTLLRSTTKWAEPVAEQLLRPGPHP